MTHIKAILNSKYSYIFGLASFVLYSVSFLIGYEDESANHMLIIVKAGLIFVSSLLFLISCNRLSSSKVKTEFCLLSCMILIWQIMLFFAVGRTIFLIRDYPDILSIITWTAVSIISLLRFRKSLINYILNIINDHNTLLLFLYAMTLAMLITILSAEPNGVRFSWDSDTLYNFIYHLDFDSLFDAKLLTFHSHVSIAYAYLLVLFKFFFNDLRLAFFMLNAFCIFAASFGMTFLLRSMIPGRKNFSYMLSNAMFMFSPWVCGLSTYHIYDYYIWCLFPLLIYYMFKKNWVGFFVLGFFITFSKASGLIVFGSVCIGIVLTDLVASRFNISKTLTDIKNWFFASIAFVFFIFFRFGIPKATQFEDTYWGLNPKHITQQIKLYTTANFLWIFVTLTLLLIIILFFKKDSDFLPETKKSVSILLISDALFILFNCICITYRIPRYMDSHIAIVYICAALFFLIYDYCNVKHSAFINLTMGIITLVSLFSSFRTIDPVSLLLFTKGSVGDHDIIDYEISDRVSLNDSIVCNREYYSYEVVLGKVLEYVLEKKETGDEIMFSLGSNRITWGFSGGRYSYSLDDGKHYFEEFYDHTLNGIANGYDYEYYNASEMTPFDMHYVFPEETISDTISDSRSNCFYYIYMPTLNDGKEEEIKTDFKTIEEMEFEFRGWHMNCIKFQKEDANR